MLSKWSWTILTLSFTRLRRVNAFKPHRRTVTKTCLIIIIQRYMSLKLMRLWLFRFRSWITVSIPWRGLTRMISLLILRMANRLRTWWMIRRIELFSSLSLIKSSLLILTWFLLWTHFIFWFKTGKKHQTLSKWILPLQMDLFHSIKTKWKSYSLRFW